MRILVDSGCAPASRDPGSIRILSTVTPRFHSLVERWLRPSLHRLGHADDLQVFVDESRQARGSGNFRTSGFDQHVFNKLECIAHWAERESEPFLVTDADIIYVRPFTADVLDLLDGKDLLLAREYPERVDRYNIGQMVVRPTPATARFFGRVADDLRRGAGNERRSWLSLKFGPRRPANQDYLDRELRASTLRHGPLPETFVNTAIWETLEPDRRQQIVAYHATKTLPSWRRTSLEQKHERLAEVARECGLEISGA